MKSRVLVGGTYSPPSTNLPRALGFAINHFSFQKNKRQSSSSSKRELFIQVFTFFCQKKKEVSGKVSEISFFFSSKKKKRFQNLFLFFKQKKIILFFSKEKKGFREVYEISFFFVKKKKEISNSVLSTRFSKIVTSIWDSIRKCLRFK